MKKVIRLTESDLHRVIKESVKQVMNELDWRTYDNAARKSYFRARDAQTSAEREYHKRRYDRFNNATKNAFEKKFGTRDMVGRDNPPRNNREVLGQAQFAIHNRGGDEYIPGKGYRRKSEE